jgi:sec-independent protein translocase protein TatC
MALDQEDDLDEYGHEKEMSFIDHLEELRWHLIRSAIVIVTAMVAAFFFMEKIYQQVIMAPAKTDFWTYKQMCAIGKKIGVESLCVDKIDFVPISRTVTGQFMTALTSSLIIGLVASFPFVFWEVWRFITPGLKDKERKAARGAVFYVTLLLAIGIMFGYYIVTPLAINFLLNFKLDPSIQNQIDIADYVSFLTISTVACALTFQMPIIVFVLSKINLVTPKFMRDYRRHAFVVILIIAAIITPSPDPFSMMIVAIPLYALYEISIFVSARVEKNRLKDELA